MLTGEAYRQEVREGDTTAVNSRHLGAENGGNFSPCTRGDSIASVFREISRDRKRGESINRLLIRVGDGACVATPTAESESVCSRFEVLEEDALIVQAPQVDAGGVASACQVVCE